MESPNLGPQWFWNAMITCAVIGIIGSAYLLVKGIIWLVEHVTIQL